MAGRNVGRQHVHELLNDAAIILGVHLFEIWTNYFRDHFWQLTHFGYKVRDGECVHVWVVVWLVEYKLQGAFG